MPTLDEQFEKHWRIEEHASPHIGSVKVVAKLKGREERAFLAGAAAEREAAAQIADQCWHENGAICSDQDNCGIHVHTRLSASAPTLRCCAERESLAAFTT